MELLLQFRKMNRLLTKLDNDMKSSLPTFPLTYISFIHGDFMLADTWQYFHFEAML